MKLDQIEGNEQLSVGYKRNRQLFAIEMERELVEYLKKSADIFYGLSPAEVRKLVYQLATAHSIEVPLKWSELQQASPDWFTTFLKRRLVLLVQRVSTEKMYVVFLTTLTLSCRGTNFNTVTPGIWTNRSGWMKGGHLLELKKHFVASTSVQRRGHASFSSTTTSRICRSVALTMPRRTA